MRLTSREKEILDLLKKEPLISQEEMAQRFGITRSSVAVHISNLMKKGVILGKGYVLNETASVVVLGNCMLTVEVRKQNGATAIDLDWGGFAYKACHTLADFGSHVKIVSVLGNDEQGDLIVSQLAGKKVDVSNIYRHNSRRTNRQIWCDGKILFNEGFYGDDYEKAVNLREWVIFNCEWLVVEPVWQEYVYRKAVNKDGEKLPCLCTCLSLRPGQSLPDYLDGYNVLVLGVEDYFEIDAYRSRIHDMINAGMEHCIITDGHSAVMHMDNHGIQEYPLLPNQSFDYARQLLYLLCGLVYGLSNNYPLRQSVRMGVGTASTGS
jgi:DNA-binding CsgD family transcriptional regulator/sugar/nucleoside kinase (ribokinase family)